MSQTRKTEEDIIDRAEARQHLHSTFREAYDNQQRSLSLWTAFFILLFALCGLALCLPAILAWFGRP